MNIMRAIVIDDEKPSRELMCNYIMEYCSDVKVIATASSVKTAYNTINKYNPDLIFLDIELGDGNGFNLLNMFRKIDFKIIFVTAYSQYAINAFRVNAIDYLLKPLDIEHLKSAVEKVKGINGESGYSEKISAILKDLTATPAINSTIAIPHIKGFEVLKINEIIMCKADGYCTNFHLTEKRKLISSKNLKHYEQILSDYCFVRVHHSYIVNIAYICSYSKQGEIRLSEDNIAFLGDAYKSSFLKLYLRK
jgi:two-component system LytT family response regulator